MNKELFIKTIKEECSFLETDGYILNQLENNIFYTKTTDNEGFRISFSWAEYVDKFYIHGLSAEKRFNEIEQKLKKILGGELDRFYTIYTCPAVDNDYIPTELSYQLNGSTNFRFEINTENDLKLFCGYVKTFYQKNVLLFLANFSNLEQVKNWMGNNDFGLHQKLINPNGNTMMLRKLLIMKETNDDTFQNLYDRYKLFLFQKHNEKESPYVDMYQVFVKFDEYFTK